MIEYGHIETPGPGPGRLQGRGRGRRHRRAAGGRQRGRRRARAVRRRRSPACRSRRRRSSSCWGTGHEPARPTAREDRTDRRRRDPRQDHRAGAAGRGRRLPLALVRQWPPGRPARGHGPRRDGPRRPSSWAPRSCRPIPAIRCCRPVEPLRSSRRWVVPASPSVSAPPTTRWSRAPTAWRSTTRVAARRSTSQILTTLLRGEGMEFEGEDWTVRAPEGSVRAAHPVPVLLSALSPRLLRVAGEHADGTVLWMAPRAAIESHVVPRIAEAATAAGRPAPADRGRPPRRRRRRPGRRPSGRGRDRGGYESRPIYKRIMAVGGADSAAEAAIVGDEASVEAQVGHCWTPGRRILRPSSSRSARTVGPPCAARPNCSANWPENEGDRP